METIITPRYASRARAAGWSKRILVVITILSLLVLPFSFDIESAVVAVGLVAVTYFEYRVNRYFREGNLVAPTLGFRNQTIFAAAILVYGLYHAFQPTVIPQEYRDMLDPPTQALLQRTVRDGYMAVGIVGGISQFALAWYYRSAAKLSRISKDVA